MQQYKRQSRGEACAHRFLRVVTTVLVGLVAVMSIGCTSHRSTSNDSFFVDNDAPQQNSLPPPGYTVKGNISVSSGAKLYHVPGMRDYEITVIDLGRGERWFRTEEEAIANGWRRAVNQGN